LTSGILTRPLSLFEAPAAEPTLDDVIADAWQTLTTNRTAACPVCGSDMLPEFGTGALPVGGRCSHCGSTLR
jgi:DNA-directed RNA polymerase subunit RPC12/RpoP